jgi:uncharacterized protein (TIGR00251 family)
MFNFIAGYRFMLEKYIENLAKNREVYLKIKVLPGQPETGFSGMMADGTIKIGVAAVPEKGEANQELIKFLATALGVRRYQVEIMSGVSGRRKLIKVSR